MANNNLTVQLYHDGNRFVVALVQTKRKNLYAVVNDGLVRVRKLPLTDARHMQPLDYNINKAKRALRRQGRAFGITKQAKKLLRAKS